MLNIVDNTWYQVSPPWFCWNAIKIVCGVEINEPAKITGITPETLIFNGK